MRFLAIALFGTLMASGIASAGDKEHKIHVEVIGDGDHAVHWVGDGADFKDLEVGETKTIETEGGPTVTVTRTEDGLDVEVDGDSIAIPHAPDGETMAFMMKDGKHENVDIKVMRAPHAMATRIHAPDGITIISKGAIDESTQETIRSVLATAGHADEVRFVDSSSMERRVKVVKKVEVIAEED